jgi:hypothetical protein
MGWNKRIVEYHNADDTVRLSIAFTWDLPIAYQRVIWHTVQKKRVIVGGPAVMLMPHYLADIAEQGQYWPDAVSYHNADATFTSRGCIRRCPFCAVWRIEGTLKELDDWPVRPVVCDNNLLACSRAHFDAVIDKLKPLSSIDFNQGLDARLLTKYHADRLAELDISRGGLRLAFDNIAMERSFLNAYTQLRNAGFAKSRIRVYVLIGYNDNPDDARYRLERVSALGIEPNPMRYNPLDALVRDQFVMDPWTDSELSRFMRYWSRLRWFRSIPFDDFRG